MATEIQKITTYNGKVINFYPNSHQYRYEGERTNLLSPSAVVGIVDKSQPLLIWAERLTLDYVNTTLEEDKTYSKTDITEIVAVAIDQRNIKLEEAKDVGTVVHDYAEMSAYHKAYKLSLPEVDYDNLTDQQLNGIQSFIKFETEHNCEYIEAERFVYSEKHGVPFVGKLDTIMQLNSDNKRWRILGDFKTGKSIYTTHKIQLAGYDLAMIEEYEYKKSPLPYDGLGIIHLDKETGEPKLILLTEEERKDMQNAFINALHLKNITKKYDKYK